MFTAVKGGTLLYPVGASKQHHLLVLLTDPVGPPGHILTVNVTSVAPGRTIDPACILKPGDHPFIVHESYVYYRDLRADLTAQRLMDGVQKVEFVDQGALDAAVFKRVLDGVYTSKFAAPFAKTFLADSLKPAPVPKPKRGGKPA